MEKVRSGEGHDEIAGVGGMDGEGEEARRGGKGSISGVSSMIAGSRLSRKQAGNPRVSDRPILDFTHDGSVEW